MVGESGAVKGLAQGPTDISRLELRHIKAVGDIVVRQYEEYAFPLFEH